MNSIESYSPPKAFPSDSEDASKTEGLVMDGAALENLRALMGGFVMPQPGFQQGSNTPGDSAGGGQGNLLAMLEELLTDGHLPPSLNALVTGLRGTLAGGGDAASSPEAVNQMKALLQGLQSADQPQVQTQALADSLAIQPNVKQALADALTKELAAPDTEVRAEIAPAPEAVTLGNSILQSLGSQSSTAMTPVTEAAGVATAERIDQVSTLMTQMADRVLVTDPLHGQTSEVRIKLADNIMPGTEVRVWREDGGQLRVEFDTVSPYWARVLNEASPLLSQRLNERLSLADAPQVTVQHFGQQPEDGRSRNRYTPWEMAQNQANEP